MSELNNPATPIRDMNDHLGPLGMTIRQHAAITLRVPMSGDPELDAMIREARRLDMATAAMNAIIVGNDASVVSMNIGAAIDAFEVAEAMLSAIEQKRVEPEAGQLCVVCGQPTMHIGDKCYSCCQAPQHDAEGWIEWKGGDCPVRRDAIVDVKLRDVHQVIRRKADCFDWSHEEHPQDIIAYRVVK